jgi:threonine/homoserine/homoserine lactone efflux protein
MTDDCSGAWNTFLMEAAMQAAATGTTLAMGMIVGLSVAAPIGPVSLICIRRALEQGPRVGIISGLGAATAHGLFAAVAILCGVMLAELAAQFDTEARLASGALLATLGLRTLWHRGRTAGDDGSHRGPNALVAYGGALLLALSNPMTFLPYLAIACGDVIGDRRFALTLAGVLIGATAWYVVLSGGVSLLRGCLGERTMRWLNVASGITLFGMGLRMAAA